MKTIAAVMLSLCLLPVGWAAPAKPLADAGNSPVAPDAATSEALVKLGGQLMLAGKAYEYDRDLADNIGPRLTGSANFVKATDWAVDEFKRMGLSNVHREAWEINATWEPEVWATGRFIQPHEQRLHLESDGWSPSTPSGGVRGNVYHLASFKAEDIKAAATQIKDAIVLVDRDTIAASGPIMFGKILDAINLISSDGARAVLLGVGDTNNVSSMIGLGGGDGKIAPLPIGNVGKEDTLLMRRLLEEGPVEIEFSFKNRIRQHVKVNNVVAEIPGTDANGEYVVVGGHLDSWHLGTGAEDNGTGAASVLAVAQAVEASGVKPKRAMRFILFGGEEEGLLGSIRYAREHAAEMDKCEGVFITDTGSEAPEGWYTFGREDEQKALAGLKPELTSLGAAGTTDDGEYTFSTDHGPFLIHGVPAFVLWNPTDKYFLLHHKPSDTFDKVNQRDLNLGVAVVGVTALAFADAQTDLPHLSQQEMEQQLRKIKAFDEYQDMQSHGMF
ncbi:MAG TPA: M20/M25/M40 family metallo-hydrolase [Terracidiphilus sp.]|nr:M20/M25/M40 family metallo-hydrolase [Terracidiphilus sp.]